MVIYLTACASIWIERANSQFIGGQRRVRWWFCWWANWLWMRWICRALIIVQNLKKQHNAWHLMCYTKTLKWSNRPGKLTWPLLVLSSFSADWRMLLSVLGRGFGCILDLGRGTGFIFTSSSFTAVTTDWSHRKISEAKESETEKRQQMSSRDHFSNHFLPSMHLGLHTLPLGNNRRWGWLTSLFGFFSELDWEAKRFYSEWQCTLSGKT